MKTNNVVKLTDAVTEAMCELDIVFENSIKRKKTKYGYQIDCIKGLWGVCAPNVAAAEREAKHYFVQYWRNGEYDSLKLNT